MKLRTWTSKDIAPGTRVLLRVDANIPVEDLRSGHVRLVQACAEARRLCDLGARVAILTHLGEPQSGKDDRFSVKKLLSLFRKELGLPVHFVSDCIGEKVEKAVEGLAHGECLLLENVRFHKQEMQNGRKFARALARPFDIYINDAFGVCHRAQASVQAIARCLPSFAGEHLVAEVRELSKPISRPFVLVLGGVKLSTKLPLLERLGPRADHILLGGGVAVTFAAAMHVPLPVAPSPALCFPDDLRAARRFFLAHHEKIHLPLDVVVENSSQSMVDVGEQSMDLFCRMLEEAKTVIWNGCLGIVERKSGQAGTRKFAQALRSLHQARVVLGGGDTVNFVGEDVSAKTFVSTGGGAMLAFLAGERLPGLEVLLQP